MKRCLHTHLSLQTVSGESREDFREDSTRRLGKVGVSIAASRSFLPGNHLFCRESHSFPRANLVILGHIKKLEFRIMALMTAELECFSITKTLMGHNDN